MLVRTSSWFSLLCALLLVCINSRFLLLLVLVLLFALLLVLLCALPMPLLQQLLFLLAGFVAAHCCGCDPPLCALSG